MISLKKLQTKVWIKGNRDSDITEYFERTQTRVWLKVRIWKIRWAMEGNFLGLPLEEWKHSRKLWRLGRKLGYYLEDNSSWDEGEFFFEDCYHEWFYSPLATFIRKLRGENPHCLECYQSTSCGDDS